MGATDYDSQIDELVAKGRYDESLSILNMLEDALMTIKDYKSMNLGQYIHKFSHWVGY